MPSWRLGPVEIIGVLTAQIIKRLGSLGQCHTLRITGLSAIHRDDAGVARLIVADRAAWGGILDHIGKNRNRLPAFKKLRAQRPCLVRFVQAIVEVQGASSLPKAKRAREHALPLRFKMKPTSFG